MGHTKVCSFVPAATAMISALGLDHFLHGVTFECHSNKPKVVRSYLEGNKYSSEEIDRIVRQSVQANKSLYYIDEPLLQSIAPDIIFTQDLCDVCQVGTNFAAPDIARLPKKPQVIPLTPRSLDDVFDNALTIASALGFEENAYTLLGSVQARLKGITDSLRAHGAPVRRVAFIEWIEPVYNCGHWIPQMISLAGGTDMLGCPSGHSGPMEWEKLLRYDPEVIVVAPCGFELKRAAAEAMQLTLKPGWYNLSAVKSDSVYIADGNMFTCPATQLVDGVELLASFFHTQIFEPPIIFVKSWAKFENALI